MSNILINTILHGEEKLDKTMSKVTSIISKLFSDQYQPIIEGKTPQEAWIALQKHFQHIKLMSISWIIYNTTTQKLSNYKTMHEYTSHYQASFDKIVNFFIRTFSFTCKSTEIYF